MKNTIILLLLTLGLISCKKDNKDETNSSTTKIISEWNHYKLNGNVNTVSEITTQENLDQTTNSQVDNHFLQDVTLKFDENGKLINKLVHGNNNILLEDIVYDGKDKIITVKKFTSPTDFITTKYTWNDENNTIITRRNKDGSIFDKQVFQYDKGVKVNNLKFNSQEIQNDKTTYFYDSVKRITKENYYRDKPTVQKTLVNEYDERGNKSKEIYYDKDGLLIYKTSLTYNYDNLLINSKTFNADGDLEVETSRNYDNENRLTSNITYEAFEDSNNKEEFEYDDRNNTISWKISKNGKTISYTIYTYDDKSNLISETLHNEAGTVLNLKNIEYTYDKNSNWITRKTTTNKNKSFLTTRKIDYF